MDPGTIISLVELTAKALQCLIEVGNELKDAPNSLTAVMAETNKLWLQIKRFSIIQEDLPPESQAFLKQQVCTKECLATIRKLRDLTIDISQQSSDLKLRLRFKWLWHKGTVEELVVALSRETDRLGKLLTPEQMSQLFGLTNQVLGTTGQIDKNVERLLELVTQLNLAAPAPASSPTFDQNGIFSPHTAVGIAWYGQWTCKPGQSLSEPYFHDRERVASAAYYGDWEGVKRLLDHAEKEYRQKWINSTWMRKTSTKHSRPSGFTALHQAAYHGNKSAVDYLLAHGAWKTLRTYRDTSSSTKYSTPLDVARSLGWQHLFESLRPVVRRTVSPRILLILQERLHRLIEESYPDAHLECFNLPELEILTEFERSRLWFPLDPELKDTREGRAVHIILDKNELVVVLRWGKSRRKNFRISETDVVEVEQAVILS